ncbi:MAG: pitrilysin family protein [Hyphomicrobiaceae bacterium]
MSLIPPRRAFALVAILLAGFLAGLLPTGPAAAMKITEVTSPGGIKAWLVEEHSLPLVTMSFGFTGGSSQDPADRGGVANFLTAMLDEGAGDIDSAAFQERLEDLAVKMSFGADRDSFTGSFQSLTDTLDDGARMLALALTKPRFDAEPIERMRAQLLASIAFDAQDPDKVANAAWYRLAFGGHPYALPVSGTAQSVAAVTAKDLEAYRSRVFARDNLLVAVVGDIDAARLGPLLDTVFGGLAAKAALVDVPAFEPGTGEHREVVQMDVPQAVAQFGFGAIDRKDPDFMAAFVLNYIIGGGGFSSKLMEEVREKRGLAYSVYSYLQTYQRSSIYVGGVATKNEGIGQSLDVIRDVLKRMAEEGPSDKDLADAKQYLTGSYALRFSSSQRIAGQLLGIQFDDLGIDYVDNRNGMVEAVTLEDIRRVARRFLKPENLIVTVVGKPTGLVPASAGEGG